jgi:DNA mismatch repair protein MutL
MINRIAAGEVVERPASVLKELVENSLDAGATTVTIHVSGGGRRLVAVRDDGDGMDRDDAVLALERHATSKLGVSSDLDALSTLGFRPSIAAVSRFLLRTAPRDGDGTEVEVRGGRIVAVREVGLPKGTSVEVASLFFNTPGRRKFLRAEATELAHLVRLAGRLALARPDVQFRLEHDGRCLLEAPRVSSRLDRISTVHGAELADKLLPVERAGGGVAVSGYAGRPVDALPRRDAQLVWVNGRAVQDRVLTHAIREAYGNTMARDRHPAVFLFLEVDPRQVDVNVHPQKSEVRFARSSEVHDAVRDALVGALGGTAAIPSHDELRPGVALAALRFMEARGAVPETTPVRPASRAHAVAERPDPIVRRPVVPPRSVVPLAQYRDSYIIAQDETGLVVVDQHAAHERVLFERYLADAEANRVEIQGLLLPVAVELPPHERVLLEEESDEFRRLGFVLEAFGHDTVRIDGVPSVAAGVDPAALLRELLGEGARTRSASAGALELRRKVVTTAACRAAIKVNHRLSVEGMSALLDDLFRTASPTTCPHGRPVLFRLTLEEMERTFRRR